jgi:quercetin dioxygenase-like cupin family protein
VTIGVPSSPTLKGSNVKNTLIAATMTAAALVGEPANAQEIQVFPSGSSPSLIADPKNFSGQVVVDLLTPPSIETPASSGLVTFASRARTAWHSHPAGQMLIVTAGKGWVQRKGQARQEIRSGDAVWIPAGVKHWHGATDTNGMSHVAITYIQNGKNADWMELVTDQEYATR